MASSSSQEKAIQRHRRRLKQRGLKRVEVEAAGSDAALIRKIAKLLRSDEGSADLIRSQLTELLASKTPDLKSLLVAVPLEGIKISRSQDRGRKIDL